MNVNDDQEQDNQDGGASVMCETTVELEMDEPSDEETLYFKAVLKHMVACK